MLRLLSFKCVNSCLLSLVLCFKQSLEDFGDDDDEYDDRGYEEDNEDEQDYLEDERRVPNEKKESGNKTTVNALPRPPL